VRFWAFLLDIAGRMSVRPSVCLCTYIGSTNDKMMFTKFDNAKFCEEIPQIFQIFVFSRI
jgi:hypothetical protein